MGKRSSELCVRQDGAGEMDVGQVLLGCLQHGTSFGLQPKDGKKFCGILVFRSSWPLVGRVVWNRVNVEMARAAN